jgi:acetyltransferase
VVNHLSDGTPLVIRHIEPEDKPLLVDGLAHLSPESVYRRFLSPKPRLSNSELRYLTELDGRDHVALVALPADDPSHLLGVARFVRLEDDPETAEAAVVVADSLQGRGLGKLLALKLADEAAAHGIRRFTATILSDNVPAQRLMGVIAERLDRGPADGPARELSVELSQAA